MNAADVTRTGFGILAWIGGVGTLITVSGAIGAVSTWIAKKWFERDLAKGLETHKADLKKASDREIEELKAELARVNGRELEALKHDLTSQLERSTKLLDREFEVLPRIWEAVSTGVSAAGALVEGYEESVDALSMSNHALESLLVEHGVPASVVYEVMSASGAERQKRFARATKSSWLYKHQRLITEGRNLLLQNSVSVEPTVYEKLRVIINMARVVGDEARKLHQDNALGEFSPFAKHFAATVDKLIEEAEIAVRSRIWLQSAATRGF